jgi:hypothetical protein
VSSHCCDTGRPPATSPAPLDLTVIAPLPDHNRILDLGQDLRPQVLDGLQRQLLGVDLDPAQRRVGLVHRMHRLLVGLAELHDLGIHQFPRALDDGSDPLRLAFRQVGKVGQGASKADDPDTKRFIRGQTRAPRCLLHVLGRGAKFFCSHGDRRQLAVHGSHSSALMRFNSA